MTLIEEARHAANGLTIERLPYAAELVRRLADALDMQRIDLETRTKCHEEAMGALRGAQAALLEARGILEAIRGLPEPEGWAFAATIRCLRQWKVACGPAPFFVTDQDLDQLETWGKELLKSHGETRQALACPRREVG